MSHSGSRDGDDGRGRAILHIDADSFFLSVHARATGDASLLTAPCVVWQYNDVFCASQAAKALGVRKQVCCLDEANSTTTSLGVLAPRGPPCSRL